MSDIPRYRPVSNDRYGITDDADGKLCEYRDYARLKAEVERLTVENESLQTKATNIYNAMVVKCKIEEITHKANADSIISQCMMSEAMKLMEESIAIRAQVERLTKAVMHSPAAQLKLKELEGKTTFDEINPDNQ